jgi:hypothetical protein
MCIYVNRDYFLKHCYYNLLIFVMVVVKHIFKVIPSTRYVSAANVICKESNNFNKDKITLIDI